MSINVKIVQLGKGIFHYEEKGNVTVGAGLVAAGITAGNMDVRVNGKRAPLGQTLQDGDLVTIIPLIKGGWVLETE
jgi:sulfur carrier protein ThiS